MLIGSYLKPELSASIVTRLEDAQIYPSHGYLVSHGLSDAVKRLARESGLGVKIYADKIPFEGNSFSSGKELDIAPSRVRICRKTCIYLLKNVPTNLLKILFGI